MVTTIIRFFLNIWLKVPFGYICRVHHKDSYMTLRKDYWIIVTHGQTTDACSPAGPYAASYQGKGLDIALASSMLLKNPHLTQKICANINGALSVAHQRGLTVSNAPLQALAASLGLDAHTTQTMMAKQAPVDLPSPQMVPATELQEAPSAPATSMEPNL